MTIATLCTDCLDEFGYGTGCYADCRLPHSYSGACRPAGSTRCDNCGEPGFLKELEVVHGVSVPKPITDEQRALWDEWDEFDVRAAVCALTG